MKHEKIFDDMLKELNLDTVFKSGFTPLQIYYQLETATSKILESIKTDIEKRYKDHIGRIAKLESTGHTVKSIPSESEDTTGEIATEDETNKAPEEICEDLSIELEDGYISESEETIENEEWEDLDASSFDEVVGLPAHEALEIIMKGAQKHKKC
ncbi:hypothetical protein PAEPH01_0926 [Pancytospora epiphaga]|nr:hypothetical protein PAEPH01_0926 [Pancytospora epiphaga]